MMDRRCCWVAGWLVLGALVAMPGCSDSGSAGPEECDPDFCESGVFVDAVVQGLDYETETPLVFVDGVPAGARRVAGVTDKNGTFRWDPRVFNDSDAVNVPVVTFRVGQVELGSAPAASTLTPLDLVEGAKDETDTVVTQLVRFLLTLDEDGIRDSIEISDAARDLLSARTIDFKRRSQVDQVLTEVAAELGPVPAECGDGLDNDNDDLVDGPPPGEAPGPNHDPDCDDAEDDLEDRNARPIQSRVVLDSVAQSHLATTLVGINAGCWEGIWEATGLEGEASPNCGSVGTGVQGRWSIVVEGDLKRSTTGNFADASGTFCNDDPTAATCPRAVPDPGDQGITGKVQTSGTTILNNQDFAIEGTATRRGRIVGFYSGGGLGNGCFVGEHVDCP